MPKPCTTSASSQNAGDAECDGAGLDHPVADAQVAMALVERSVDLEPSSGPGSCGLASQQPMQGEPAWTHQLRRLFHSVTPQFDFVWGPRQPNGYRQYPLASSSEPN